MRIPLLLQWKKPSGRPARAGSSKSNLTVNINYPRSIDQSHQKGIEDTEQVNELCQELTGRAKEQSSCINILLSARYEMELAARTYNLKGS